MILLYQYEATVTDHTPIYEEVSYSNLDLLLFTLGLFLFVMVLLWWANRRKKNDDLPLL